MRVRVLAGGRIREANTAPVSSECNYKLKLKFIRSS
jgi:hypothetical protein